MEDKIRELITEYHERSMYKFNIGDIDGCRVYDRVIEDLEKLLE